MIDHAGGLRGNLAVVLAVAVPPLQLFEVAVKVLLAHLAERADDAPLEQRPHALDAVRVNSAVNPLLDAVVHGLMAGVVVGDAEVGRHQRNRTGGAGPRPRVRSSGPSCSSCRRTRDSWAD